MSTSRFSGAPTVFQINEPVYVNELIIDPLDSENIIKFEESEQIALTEREKDAIKKLFEAHTRLSKLADFIHNFIKLNSNYEAFAGLTKQQIAEFSELISKRKAFREEYTNNKDMPYKTYQSFIANENKLLPLDVTLQWWTQNLEALRKNKAWDLLLDLTVTQNQHLGETDIAIKKKISSLEELKEQWVNHQAFAGYSSENMLDFYDQFIETVDLIIIDETRAKRNYPEAVRKYLRHISGQIKVIRRQAIYSMLARLEAAEFYLDADCDDVLVMTCDKMEMYSNVIIKRLGKRPAYRRGLSTAIITAYLKRLDTYIKANPDDKTLHYEFNKLRMNNMPEEWRILSAEEPKLSAIMHDPCIIQLNAFFPDLLELAYSDKAIETTILTTDQIQANAFILNKMRTLIQRAKQQFETITGKKLTSIDNIISRLINHADKRYDLLMNDIYLKINLNIDRKMEALLDNIFESKELNFDMLNNLMPQIKNAEAFSHQYLNVTYFAPGDIILALSRRIRNLIIKNQTLTPAQCANILAILKIFYPSIQNDQVNHYKRLFNKLPNIINTMKESKEYLLFHYISHYLEIPFLTKSQISLALQRHKYINDTFNQEWIDVTSPGDASDEKSVKIHEYITYVKNIKLKVIKFCPAVTLDNFDNIHTYSMINELDLMINREISAKNKYALEIKAQSDAIRREYEFEILNKINDVFIIKRYLYNENELKIDVNKLHQFINKINTFFKNTDSRNIILESLLKSCLSLLKIYFLNAIEKDAAPDLLYISDLNASLGKNLFQRLCRDLDVRTIIKAYIEVYDGTKVTLSRLLTSLTPIDNLCDCETLLCSYAKKRLEYLKTSRDIQPEDYYFYSHYISIPDITKLFTDFKTSFEASLKTALNNTDASWDKNTAQIIELTGTDAEVKTYRAKRIYELLNHQADSLQSEEDVSKIFSAFSATINPTRLFNERIIATDTTSNNNLILMQQLDDAIANKPWSYHLEKLVNLCGSTKQIQQLHLKQAQQYLAAVTDGGGKWLELHLNNNSLPASATTDVDTIFFQQFYGAENMISLCNDIETKLQELITMSNALNNSELSQLEYQNLLMKINRIKPFYKFFNAFSRNRDTVQFFTAIAEFENKVQLHYELHTVLKQHTILLDISQDDTKLHNLILSLTQSIRQLERKRVLSEKNIDQYLNFLDNEILKKLEISLLKPKSHLNYKLISTLANLISYLASDHLKTLLLNAHKNAAMENPFWLSLINHLDEKFALSNIEIAVEKQEITIKHTKEFIDTLYFAKRLTNLKHNLNLTLKQLLLKEANISASHFENVKLQELLQSKNIKDTQLIKLWSACADKLCKVNANPGVRVSYIHFLSKQLIKIANTILFRSQENPGLLTKFIEQLSIVSEINQSIANALDEPIKPATEKRVNSMWTPVNDVSKLTRPISTICEKAYALQLMQSVEKYALQKIEKNLLPEFKKISNDSSFISSPKINVAMLQNSLHIKKELNAVKLFNAMRIYNKLTQVYNNKLSIDSIKAVIDDVIVHANQNQHLVHSRSFSTFLREIRTLTINHLKPKNDKEYGHRTTHQPLTI